MIPTRYEPEGVDDWDVRLILTDLIIDMNGAQVRRWRRTLRCLPPRRPVAPSCPGRRSYQRQPVVVPLASVSARMKYSFCQIYTSLPPRAKREPERRMVLGTPSITSSSTRRSSQAGFGCQRYSPLLRSVIGLPGAFNHHLTAEHLHPQVHGVLAVLAGGEVDGGKGREGEQDQKQQATTGASGRGQALEVT